MPSSRTELSFRGPVEPGCLDRTHDLLAQLWQEQPDVAEMDQIMFSTAVLEVASNIVSHGGAGTVSIVLQGDAGSWRLASAMTEQRSKWISRMRCCPMILPSPGAVLRWFAWPWTSSAIHTATDSAAGASFAVAR